MTARRRAPSAPARRDDEQLGGAVAEAIRSGSTSVAMGQLGAQLARALHVAVQPARAMKVIASTTQEGGYSGQVVRERSSSSTRRQRLAAALVGLLAQPRADLLGPRAPRTACSGRAGPSGAGAVQRARRGRRRRHPQAEQRHADDRGVGEDAADHAARAGQLPEARRTSTQARSSCLRPRERPQSASAGCRRRRRRWRRRCARRGTGCARRSTASRPGPAPRRAG